MEIEPSNENDEQELVDAEEEEEEEDEERPNHLEPPPPFVQLYFPQTWFTQEGSKIKWNRGCEKQWRSFVEQDVEPMLPPPSTGRASIG